MFVTVYIIAAFGEMLILLPGELVLLNTNTAYQDAAASGDMEQLSEVSVQIAGSDAYAVLKLFPELPCFWWSSYSAGSSRSAALR